MTTLASRVRETLELGFSDLETAKRTLKLAGARGIPQDGESCPIAVYLKHRFPELDTVERELEVNEGVTYWPTDEDLEAGEATEGDYVGAAPRVEIEVDGVLDFVKAFDRGDLPEFDMTLDWEKE